MTFTVSLAEFSIFIIAISFLILVISAILTLFQLRQTAKALQDFSEEGKTLIAEVKEITHKVNGQVSDMGEAVKKVKDVSLKAAEVTGVIVDAIKKPAITLAIAGIMFGIKHFRKGGKKNE